MSVKSTSYRFQKIHYFFLFLLLRFIFSSSVLPPSWSTTSVPPPSVHGGPTWPNSPIWGFSLHPPPSQSAGKPVMPSFESKLQESNPARTTSPAQRFSVTSLTHGLPMTSPPPALPVMSPPGSLTSPPHGMAQGKSIYFITLRWKFWWTMKSKFIMQIIAFVFTKYCCLG